MRLLSIPILVAGGLLAITGCSAKSHMALKGDDGKSSLTIDNGKVTAESTDDNGKKNSIDIEGTAHISLHDEDGKGLTFNADKGGVSLKAKGDEGETSLETGTSLSESDLGLPFYPGSTEVPAATLTFDGPKEKGAVSCRQTLDEPEKVIEYYKPLVRDQSVVTATSDSELRSELKGKNDAGAEIGIEAKREKGEKKTTVSVAVVTKKVK